MPGMRGLDAPGQKPKGLISPYQGLPGFVGQGMIGSKKGGTPFLLLPGVGVIRVYKWFDPSVDSLNTETTPGSGNYVSTTDKVTGQVLKNPAVAQAVNRQAPSGSNKMWVMNGTTGYFQDTGKHGIPIVGGGDVWMFTVASIDLTTSPGLVVYGNGPIGPSVWNYGRGVNINGGSYNIVSDRGSFNQVSYGDSWRVLATQFTDTAFTLFATEGNAGPFTQGPTAPGSGTLYDSGLTLGNASGSASTVDLGDVIFTGPVSVPQRQFLEGYLAWKFNVAGVTLPSTHPYRNAAPPQPTIIYI